MGTMTREEIDRIINSFQKPQQSAVPSTNRQSIAPPSNIEQARMIGAKALADAQAGKLDPGISYSVKGYADIYNEIPSLKPTQSQQLNPVIPFPTQDASQTRRDEQDERKRKQIEKKLSRDEKRLIEDVAKSQSTLSPYENIPTEQANNLVSPFTQKPEEKKAVTSLFGDMPEPIKKEDQAVQDYASMSGNVSMRDTMSGQNNGITAGTLYRGDISDEDKAKIEKLTKKIDKLNKYQYGSNNQAKAERLQKEIDSIYETRNSSDEENIARILDKDVATNYEKDYVDDLFDKYLEANPKAKDLYNTNDAAMSTVAAMRLSPQEAEEYQRMVALKNKVDAGNAFASHMVESIPFVKSLADKSSQMAGELYGYDGDQYNFSNQLEASQKQNPEASLAGNAAYQLASYAAFAPLLEGVPVVGKAAEKAGSLFKNPAMANAVKNIVQGQAADVVLDTLPNAVIPDITEGNWKDLPKDVALNQFGNLAFNVGGEAVGALAKNVIPSLNNKMDDIKKGKLTQLSHSVDDTLPRTPEANSLSASFDSSVPPLDESVKGEMPISPTEPPKDLTRPVNSEEKERGLANHIRSQVDVTTATPMKMEGVSDEVAADFANNKDMYKVLKNEDTKALADNIYASGDAPISINGKEYTGDVETKFRTLLSEKSPASLPLGHQLAKEYSAAGNHEMAAQIYRDMGQALTESGQFSQAAIINMVKDDPLTALSYAEREIAQLNTEGAKRFGDKWHDFSLSDEEKALFENIEPGDSEAIKNAFEAIGQRLGYEYPIKGIDKLIEARRVAMLFNPRTNARNFFANPPTLGLRWMADRIDALGQGAVHLINPDFQMTQSLYGGGIKGRKLATDAWKMLDSVQALKNASGSKADLPELKNSVMQHKQVFKGTKPEQWIDKVTNNGIQRLNEKLFKVKGVKSLAETTRNATYKLLDLGDSPFVRENFIERLGSYIAAQKINNLNDIPEDAIQMAWEEAMKATYKDNSWLVDAIKKFKKGMEALPGGKVLSNATIPYVQAPGNIGARMVDYSPIGGTKGIADIISGAKNKNEQLVRKGIEEFSKGTTGTLAIALGMKLKEAGLLTGTYSDNKRQKEFQKQNGFREFALHLGDNYFTYDWAQPFAENLMLGTLLQEAIEKSDEYDSDILREFGIEGSSAGKAVGVAREGAKAAVNSWFNETPLANLADLMKGNSYSDTDIAGNLWENGVQDFAGALIPAVVNATAKTVDPIQRNTYNPDNSFDSFLNSNIAKLPKLSEKLPAKYNGWGEEVRYGDTRAAAAAAKMLVPGEYTTEKNDPINDELNRIYSDAPDEEKDDGIFPTIAPNKVGEKTLNNKEVSAYQQDMGQRSRQMVEAFMNSKTYQMMPDSSKAEVIKKIYATSKAITERNLFNKPVAENSQYKGLIKAFDTGGIPAVMDELEGKQLASEANVKSNSNLAKQIHEAVNNGNKQEAQAMVDSSKSLQDLGLTKSHVAEKFYYAQGEMPTLTAQEFADNYKAMDADHNQGIKQTEFLDYVNAHDLDADKVNELWTYYVKGTSPKSPILTDDGWKLK